MTFGDRKVGIDHPTYLIAEIGANFNQSLDQAKRLCDAAKEAGADCAKFQSFISEKIVSQAGFSSMTLRGVHGTWKKPISEVFRDAEFPRDWHAKVMEHCRNIGIHFSTSPYDFEAVDLCRELRLPFLKIGSGEITWHEMLDYAARKELPLILATGDATLAEVDEALRVIHATGNRNLVLLQCITNYPSKIESANIRVIQTYQSAFEVLTGYSDHSPGDVVALGAVALGGRVIEKHFTLDQTDAGPDHPHSMNPVDFKAMVRRIRDLEKAMGSTQKFVVEEESETVFVQRRGLCAARDLSQGTALIAQDIDVLRPALGVAPKFKPNLIGRRIRVSIAKGAPIRWEDLG